MREMTRVRWARSFFPYLDASRSTASNACSVVLPAATASANTVRPRFRTALCCGNVNPATEGASRSPNSARSPSDGAVSNTSPSMFIIACLPPLPVVPPMMSCRFARVSSAMLVIIRADLFSAHCFPAGVLVENPTENDDPTGGITVTVLGVASFWIWLMAVGSGLRSSCSTSSSQNTAPDSSIWLSSSAANSWRAGSRYSNRGLRGPSARAGYRSVPNWRALPGRYETSSVRLKSAITDGGIVNASLKVRATRRSLGVSGAPIGSKPGCPGVRLRGTLTVVLANPDLAPRPVVTGISQPIQPRC